jgi:hypothetical protein
MKMENIRNTILSVLVMLVFSTHAQLQQPPPPPGAAERLKHISEEIEKEINLTVVQKEKVKTAYKQFFDNMDQLRGKGKIGAPPPPPPPGEKEAIDKLSKARDEQIRQAFSEAQYKKYKEIEKTLHPPAPPNGMPPPVNK